MIDNQYFSNINYYKMLLKNNISIIDASNLYQKGWFGNKCVIIGANGSMNLSVPLLGGRNQKTLLKDVKIAYHQNWRQQHQRAIFSCYGNAPFFDYYKFEIENIFEQQFENLFDLNFYILKKIMKLLKTDIEFSININPNSSQENVVATKKYWEMNQPIQHIKYAQVFEDRNGFVENVSILDLLFCMGPQAKEILIK